MANRCVGNAASAFTSSGHSVRSTVVAGAISGGNAAQQKELLDNLVGAGEQRGRNVDAYRLGGLQVDDQLEFGWRLTGMSAGFSPLRMRPV